MIITLFLPHKVFRGIQRALGRHNSVTLRHTVQSMHSTLLAEYTGIYIMLFHLPKRRKRSHAEVVWSGISPCDSIKKQNEIWKLKAMF